MYIHDERLIGGHGHQSTADWIEEQELELEEVGPVSIIEITVAGWSQVICEWYRSRRGTLNSLKPMTKIKIYRCNQRLYVARTMDLRLRAIQSHRAMPT